MVLPTPRPTLTRLTHRTPRGRGALTTIGAGALALTLAASLAAASPAGAAGRSGGPDGNGNRGDRTPAKTGGLPGDLSQRLSHDRAIPQTSDGEPGWLVPQGYSTQKRTITTTVTEQYAIVPGLSFARFDRNDSVRGNVRGQVLVLDQGTPGLSFDYAGPSKVAKTATVATLVNHDQAIAGVNGDFFDIGDTGASLGIGVDRSDGLLKGPVSGWNAAFWVDAAGVSHVGSLAVKTKVKQHRNWTVDALNPPSVLDGGIAAYDERWGAIKGDRVTDGQTKHVRVVQVRGGRVISNRTSMPKYLKIKGKVLIGRGAGADKLARLRVGYKSGVRSSIAGSPPVAITGNKALILGGIRQVIDDQEMHPRTAIGIDHDTNRIFVVVVDGRQSFSRGMTMVELAQLMSDLGADDALNLDGGGSSTMLAPDAAGVMSVRNSPSDGHLRKVANGLVLDYVAGTTTTPTPLPPLFQPTPAPTPTPVG